MEKGSMYPPPLMTCCKWKGQEDGAVRTYSKAKAGTAQRARWRREPPVKRKRDRERQRERQRERETIGVLNAVPFHTQCIDNYRRDEASWL